MSETTPVGRDSTSPNIPTTVGIDLGTTHCALAYGHASDEASPKTMGIPQVVAVGQTQSKDLLPSFVYIPNPHEFGAAGLGLPWVGDMPYAVGAFARSHGAKVPDRLVSSAKSWLCHDGVDRTSNLLPWGGSDEIEKISPLEASTRYVRHLVDAWGHLKPELGPLREQNVVLTVPASFDAVARDALDAQGLQLVCEHGTRAGAPRGRAGTLVARVRQQGAPGV